jgi:glutamate/tyrosine decarboxylase-like PLP-dependent enzyme
VIPSIREKPPMADDDVYGFVASYVEERDRARRTNVAAGTRTVQPPEENDVAALRRRFRVGEPLPERGPAFEKNKSDGSMPSPSGEANAPSLHVIKELIGAAEAGLVDNRDPRFYSWVMGASDPTGVAADWLTSAWGQNSALFQCSPAAAVAEEAVAKWLVEDLFGLPKESSVGFVSGATIAGFVCLAAARFEVLRRAGYDEGEGLQGPSVPLVRVFLSEETHATNFAALRFLGLGSRNIQKISATADGVMIVDELRHQLEADDSPSKIIIAQAGHINSGGFDQFRLVSELASAHNAWLHVDGAFGLWARLLDEKSSLTDGLDLASSWSVDGHKWLQVRFRCVFLVSGCVFPPVFSLSL